jgi:hypothetical protein
VKRGGVRRKRKEWRERNGTNRDVEEESEAEHGEMAEGTIGRSNGGVEAEVPAKERKG